MAYTLNGFQIGGKSQPQGGVWLLDESQYAPSLEPRVASVEIPNIHYVVPMFDDPLNQINLTLAIRLLGTDPDDLRGLWNNFTGRLYMGVNSPMAVVRQRGTNTDSADAKLVTSTSPDFTCIRNLLDVTLTLVIPGGAWRGPFVEQQLGIGNDQILTTVQQSTRPITDAMLRILGPLDTADIYDPVSRTGIYWDGPTSVPNNQYLLIDVASMQARIQTTQTWDISQGTRADAGLSYTGYRPLTLTPRWNNPEATPDVHVNVTLTGGAAAVTFRTRYAVV